MGNAVGLDWSPLKRDGGSDGNDGSDGSSNGNGAMDGGTLIATFNDLPPEIHLAISQRLTYPDALSLKHTCRYFYDLVDTGIRLKVEWLVERHTLHLECPNDRCCDLRSDRKFCRGSVRWVLVAILHRDRSLHALRAVGLFTRSLHSTGLGYLVPGKAANPDRTTEYRKTDKAFTMESRLLMQRRREHMECESRPGLGCLVYGTEICTRRQKLRGRYYTRWLRAHFTIELWWILLALVPVLLGMFWMAVSPQLLRAPWVPS